MKATSISVLCVLAVVTFAAPTDLVLRPLSTTHKIHDAHSRLGRIRLPSIKDYRNIIIGPYLKTFQPVKYSANWAGVVQISTYNITEVSATIVAPNISMPAGGSASTSYSGSAWIGIDGYTCRQAIFQTGIDWSLRNGQPQYHAWYEWFPAYSHAFNLTIHAGDRLRISAVMHNATGGTATIANEATNATVSHTFHGQTPLCMQNAEWVVEDYELTSNGGTQLVPFAKFDTLHFRNASYCTTHGTHGLKNSTILEMNQGGRVVASCMPDAVHDIACVYKGDSATK